MFFPVWQPAWNLAGEEVGEKLREDDEKGEGDMEERNDDCVSPLETQ